MEELNVNLTYVAPGDLLGSSTRFESGKGVHEWNQSLLATLAGRVVLEASQNSGKQRINVVSSKACASDTVIEVGDTVIARVIRINTNQAIVEILFVGDIFLRQSAKGVVRREDVRLSEIDKLIMDQCFRPGDIIRAGVVSLGDARQYFLSTALGNHGVIRAFSQVSGKEMIPVSWKVSVF